MNHFTQQENIFTGVFFNSPECNINGILHPVTKPEMPGKVNLQGAEIEQGGAEVFLHFIGGPALLFNSADQGAAVNEGNLKGLHAMQS
jgi:hypothetical protein